MSRYFVQEVYGKRFSGVNPALQCQYTDYFPLQLNIITQAKMS